ncbi:hypothetical protein KL86APRO_30155 [uncultured Alphaproteobacteria bacterium]|uniref:Uncharacterized protein n=1 Tax=uncultured Alphaproteobacteria bacterium TaxID=91750 RepID=A0A212KLY1_9PROT|nr:hypothetical protein KL86APRO_30155 [uncultured Alphaproteobacteria bacterium]
MSKPVRTIGNVRDDIPPRCGMDRVEIQITAGGLFALPLVLVGLVWVLGYLPEIMHGIAAALRGL